MTFDERQKEIFFDGFHEISKGELTHWLDREPVMQWVGTKITRNKANRLLTEFTEGIVYVEKNDENKYRISDSGKVYYEYLKKETEKTALDKEAPKAAIKASGETIKTGLYTRRNIRIGWLLGSVTLLAILANLGITTYREYQESHKPIKDSLQQLKTQQNALQLNQELHRISLHFQSEGKNRKVVFVIYSNKIASKQILQYCYSFCLVPY